MHIAVRTLVTLALAAFAVPALAADPDPVAVVGGTPITRAQLESHVKPKLIEIESERYEALSEGLNELVANALFMKEAEARKITPEQLQAQEITAKITPPTDAEIQAVYDQNKAQLQGQTLEQVKPRIVEYLNQQKAAERAQAFIAELKAKYKTTIALKPPVVDVATAGRPEKGGGAKAPVTMIVFSDYECPYCKRGEVSVEEVLKQYGDKVRIVFRNYPLPFHADAKPAAEAALCANAQGKFWEYHTKIWKIAKLSPENLKKAAGEAGLDQAKFDKCFDSNEFAKTIDEDIAAGSAVGVTGTPAFFINGRMLSGAQPFEKFKEIIDQELAAKS